MNPNQRFSILKYSEVIEMGIQFPDWQRLVNTSHVDKIYNDVKTYMDKNLHQPILPGCLSLCVVKTSPPTWIMIDGQHRFLALKKLYEESKLDVSMMYCTITIESENEAHHWFTIVNSNIPLLRIPPHQRLTIPNQVTEKIVSLFPKLFSDSLNPRRPHLNKQELSSRLAQTISTVPGLSTQPADYITSKLLDYNNLLLTYSIDKFKYPGDTDELIHKYLTVALKKGKCLFGMYKQYEFIQHCFYPSHKQLQKPKSKQKIPKRTRTEVWRK
jgi:hypothetical protein